MPDRYSSFTTGERVALQTDLGFLALTVVVDNLTPSWVYVTAAGRYVPPFTYGATFPLGAGVQVAQAAWATPPGIVAPTAGAGQAQLTFTSALLPPSNGVAVVTPSQQVVCTGSAPTVTGAGNTVTLAANVLSFTMGNNGTAQATYAVPAGTNSLLITGTFTYSPNSSGGKVSCLVSVTGNTTSTVYVQTVGTGTSTQQPQPPVQCTVSPSADPTVTVAFQLSGSDGLGGNRLVGAGIEVVASFGGAAIAVEGSGSGNPVAVNLTTGIGGALTNDTVNPRIAISEPGTTATFTQGAANAVATINFAAPLGGRIYRFHSVTAAYSGPTTGSTFIQILNGAPAVVWLAYMRDGGSTSAPGHYVFPHGGMIVGGTPTINLSAGGAGVQGTICCTYTTE